MLFGKRDTAAERALINSGATGNLINTEFVQRHRITPKTLKSPLLVRMADDSEGLITHYIDIGLEIRDTSSEHREQIMSLTLETTTLSSEPIGSSNTTRKSTGN